MVAEVITDGACAAHPGLLEISRRPEGNSHFVFPAFTATWRSEEGTTRDLPVKVVHLEDAGEHLVPEKAYPWPAWPWAIHGRNNSGNFTLEAQTGRARLRAGWLEVKACAGGKCGVMRWPAQGR